MIVLDERLFGADEYSRWYTEKVARCHRHVWTRAPHDPAWSCTQCPAQGKLR